MVEWVAVSVAVASGVAVVSKLVEYRNKLGEIELAHRARLRDIERLEGEVRVLEKKCQFLDCANRDAIERNENIIHNKNRTIILLNGARENLERELNLQRDVVNGLKRELEHERKEAAKARDEMQTRIANYEAQVFQRDKTINRLNPGNLTRAQVEALGREFDVEDVANLRGVKAAQARRLVMRAHDAGLLARRKVGKKYKYSIA